MADFSALIQRIKDAVYENGVQAITGQILQDCLKDVVNTVNVAKQDGIYRVTVTVDNNTGVPSATARMDDDTYTLEFSFHNLKGETGPQGPQGDTPVLTADSDGVIYSDGVMLTRVIKDTTDALTTRADSDHARAESDHARAETDHTDITRARLDAETAAGEANYASLRANTAADNADAAREAIQSDLAAKQDVIVDLPQIREGATDTVKYTSQSLTDAQKEQARANIGAADESEVSQLRSEVDDKTSIKVGMTDKTILTNSTTNTSYVWFQVSPKLSHIDKIRFLAKSGTVTFHKVKVTGSTATLTEISSVVNTDAEDKAIKEISVNVDLGADEYIGINGSFYYRSSGQTGFQSAYCNAAGTTIWWTGSGFACGFEVVRYTNSIAEEYLNSKGGIFTIKKSGGDFSDIYSALAGTYGIDSASNPITIIVYPGTYITPTLELSNYFANWLQNRYLSIIGTDKVNCILRNDKGYYNASSSGENLGDNSVIKVNGNIYIANLTFICTDNDNESETSLVYHNSYCLHTDVEAAENSILEVHNCRMINDHAPCIGFGIPKNCTLKITDCELDSTFFDPTVVNGGAVIYGHDRHGSTAQVEEHLVVKNCIIQSSNGHAVKFSNNNDSLADCVFVGNACALPSGKGISLGSTTTVVAPSFGNNVQDMNATT